MNYNTEEILDKIRQEVERACTMIIEADNHDSMLYNYWGVSYFLNVMELEYFERYTELKDFFKLMNGNVQTMDYLEQFLENYENAKKDLENAHKRLF